MKILAPFIDNRNQNPDHNGLSPIQAAAMHGHSEVIEILVPYSDNPNAPNPSGWTPIQTAALNGYSNVVKLLAPLTGNINTPGPDGITPLEYASKNGHTDIEEILIQMLSKSDAIISKANNEAENVDEIMEETNFDDEENDDDEDMWECGYCHQTFHSEVSLNEHVENDHSPERKKPKLE